MRRPALADLSLRAKGLVMMAVPLAALLVATAALLSVESEQVQAERWVRHTFEVRSDLQVLLGLMGDAESAVRGYLLTRDQALLIPYRKALKQYPAAARDLAAVTADHAAQSLLARLAESAGNAGLESLSRVVDVFEQSGSPVDLRPALSRSQQSIDEARAQIAVMQREEERLLALRLSQAHAARTRMYVFIACSTLAGLMGGVLVPWITSSGVVRRIGLLRERARWLAERQPLPDVPLGADEIGKLGDALAQADSLLTQRELALRETELFLNHLIEISPTVVFRQDPATLRVTYVSANCERILGYTPEEVLDRPQFWMDQIHPDDRGRILAEDRQAMARHSSRLETEYRVRHKNGEYRWLRSFLYLEYDSGGQPTAMLGHRLDITEAKRAEADLVERQAKLDAANRDLESFSYSVSHDLRAPLRAVDGFGRILLEDHGSQLEPAARQYLDRMRAAAQHMGELIEDLLNLSRVTRAEMRLESVDLSRIVRTIADDLIQNEPARAVEFAIQPEVTAIGDPGLLRVAFGNLLHNAWKFTSRHPAARIEFGVNRDAGRAAYYVRDDGAGFDPRFRRKLFGPFQRLHTATEFPGTGIGLATVQRIVRRHGGEVWATGAVEQGATFYLTLENGVADGTAGAPGVTPDPAADSPPA